MKLATDPRGAYGEAPLMHLVTEIADSPGGHQITSLCGQIMVVPVVLDRDLDDATISRLCLACSHRAKVTR